MKLIVQVYAFTSVGLNVRATSTDCFGLSTMGNVLSISKAGLSIVADETVVVSVPGLDNFTRIVESPGAQIVSKSYSAGDTLNPDIPFTANVHGIIRGLFCRGSLFKICIAPE